MVIVITLNTTSADFIALTQTLIYTAPHNVLACGGRA
ncbi:Uncharacterised protein [Escherichia coli]|nr:Uncharacterised protein [Escherichia coli]